MLQPGKFRADVELLRGVAVILVVIFHLKLQFVSSGFIGVDIFFVISGYLMAVAFSDPQHSLWDFYERRGRRVLPAALVVMAILFLSAPVFFLPFETEKLVEQVIGMMLLVPNLVFWRIDDYFSALNFTPMLHYWSLGVELQYYILFPILVCIFRNNIRLFFILFVVSLLLCIVITPITNKTAFFMLPTRLWEFLLGFFAYHVGNKITENKVFTDTQRIFLAVTFITLLIVYACISIPKEQFPGVYAVPAATLSFLVIAIGVSNKYIDGCIGLTPLRWAGKLSYSIYLIHYPVIFIFIYQPFSEWKVLSFLDSIYIIIITLILSIISYKYVEVPFRNRKKTDRKLFFMGLLAVYVTLIATIFAFKELNYFSASYSIQESRVFKAMTDSGNSRCSKWQKIKEYNESSCYLTQAQGARFYLVGDSHIDVLKEAFVDVARRHNATVRLNRTRCFLGEAQCSYEDIVSQVKKFNISDVVLHGWDYEKFNYENIQKLIDASKKLNIKVHIIGPVPTYSKSIPLSLYKELHSNEKLIEKKTKIDFSKNISQKFNSFKEKNSNMDNVFFYSPENYLCEEFCMYEGKCGVYYYDEHHLTITGATVLKPLFEEIVDR